MVSVNLVDPVDRFNRAYEELYSLSRIKAEVNYKELGIEDGTGEREEQELASGSVQKAVITASTSGETPGASSLVFFHVTFMRRQVADDGGGGRDDEGVQDGEEREEGKDGEVLASTRTELGGPGVPCVYRLNDGRWRPLRGLEIALLAMPEGERSLVVMKPSMCFLHEDVQDSWMARALRSMIEGREQGNGRVIDIGLGGARFVHDTYQADVEMVGWINDVVDVDLDGECAAFKRIISEGSGWETPRAPFSVSLRVTQQTVAQYGVQEVTSAERTVECEIGDGTLSQELEAVVCTMRKGEEAIVLCPDTSAGSLAAPRLQDSYIEYRVCLLDMTQARDLMGDGKTMKRIARKGQGEFPIDCPMEDTRVVLKTKIRGRGTEAWSRFMAAAVDEEFEIDTGMGDAPLVVDAAVRLMLKGEVSILTTVMDDSIRRFCGDEDAGEALMLADGASVDIQVELVDFDTSPPIQMLEPDEKLVKARKFKDEGNMLYKKGLFPLAKAKYGKAINCLGKGFEFSDEDIDEVIGIKSSSMLNLAACEQQLQAYSEAIQWCERVLEDDTENTKALFRRSKALSSLAKFEEALVDLDKMLEIDPSLGEVERERVVIRRKMKQAEEKQRREFGNFFSRA
jgi:hypothetical protein